MISKLFISGFRGIPDWNIDIGKKTAIIGANGSGKTHILEAIHLASGGHLHYFQAPREDSYNLELEVASSIGPRKYGMRRRDGREEYFIQGGKVTGIKYRQDLPYRTVFLSPFDMNLLYFAPSIRRDYIDSILSRTFTQFPKLKRDYENVMRQRNALLKKIRDGEAQKQDLSFWDKTFAEKANLYHTYRCRFIDFVNSHLALISEFLPKYHMVFHYDTKISSTLEGESIVMEYLGANRDRDIVTGHTHIGPHLDDFHFFIKQEGLENAKNIIYSGLEAPMILSRGETKVLLLALKQIEILFLRKHFEAPIVLLFDDLFAELDQQHTEHIIDIFDVDQVVVTTQRSLPASEKWEDFSCIKLNLQ